MTNRRWTRPVTATALATVVALGGGLVAAGPAAADHGPTFSGVAPAGGSRVTTSSMKVNARVTMPDGRLRSISANVVPLSGGGSAVSAGPVPGEDQQTKDVSFGITLPFNGRYRAEITASGVHTLVGVPVGSPSTKATSVEFAMVAPPVAPRSVRTSADAGTRAVTVSWARNPEPDVLFYLVQRSLGGGEYVLAAKTTELTIVDTTTAQAGGEYSYQVVAVRAGAGPDEGINSGPSAASTASVPAPPAPPTTAAPEITPAQSPTSVPASTATTSASTTSSSAPAAPPESPASTIPPNSPGALTRSGTVDLSGLRALQAQPAPRRASPPTTADTGFDQNLPFDPDAAPADTAVEPEGSTEFDDAIFDETEVGAEGELGAEDDVEKTRALAFLAAGLLATVLLMHVLWVRGEVARVPLEALPPAGATEKKRKQPKGRAKRAARPARPPVATRPRSAPSGPARPGPNRRPRPRPGPDPRLARPRPDREDLPIG